MELKVLIDLPDGRKQIIGIVKEENDNRTFCKRVYTKKAYQRFLMPNTRDSLEVWTIDRFIIEKYTFDDIIIVELDGQNRVLYITLEDLKKYAIDYVNPHDNSSTKELSAKLYVPINKFAELKADMIPHWVRR